MGKYAFKLQDLNATKMLSPCANVLVKWTPIRNIVKTYRTTQFYDSAVTFSMKQPIGLPPVRVLGRGHPGDNIGLMTSAMRRRMPGGAP